MVRSNSVLQLELIKGARKKRDTIESSCGGLLGRTFFDGSSDVRVVGLCPSNPSHVMLERRADGKRWAAPSGLIRLVLGRGPSISTRRRSRRGGERPGRPLTRRSTATSGGIKSGGTLILEGGGYGAVKEVLNPG
jgi:hypothetical protein